MGFRNCALHPASAKTRSLQVRRYRNEVPAGTRRGRPGNLNDRALASSASDAWYGARLRVGAGDGPIEMPPSASDGFGGGPQAVRRTRRPPLKGARRALRFTGTGPPRMR